MYQGAKMGIAAYGGAVCWRDSGIDCGISAGVRKFQADIAIHPSGVSLRHEAGKMLAEFGINLDVVVESSDGQIQVINLKELLPSLLARTI